MDTLEARTSITKSEGDAVIALRRNKPINWMTKRNAGGKTLRVYSQKILMQYARQWRKSRNHRFGEVLELQALHNYLAIKQLEEGSGEGKIRHQLPQVQLRCSKRMKISLFTIDRLQAAALKSILWRSITALAIGHEKHTQGISSLQKLHLHHPFGKQLTFL